MKHTQKGIAPLAVVVVIVLVIFGGYWWYQSHPAETLRIISPNGGETWTHGTQQKIIWDGTNKNVDIFIWEEVYCSSSGDCGIRSPWAYTIAKNVPGPSYTWTVGNYLEGKTFDPGSFRIQVCLVGADTCDTSDAPLGF